MSWAWDPRDWVVRPYCAEPFPIEPQANPTEMIWPCSGPTVAATSSTTGYPAHAATGVADLAGPNAAVDSGPPTLVCELAVDDAHPMERDRSGLLVLSPEACLRLLATVRVGRVGFSSGALPVILPVAFALDSRGIVVRVHAGSQLYAAIRDAVVAFEVDDGDHGDAHWSVAVIGTAREIVDPSELDQVHDLPLDSWSADADDHFVRITLDLVSGRRASWPARTPRRLTDPCANQETGSR